MEVAACKLLSGLKRKKRVRKQHVRVKVSIKVSSLPKQTIGILIDLSMGDNGPC